jgi:hypothetical protein
VSYSDKATREAGEGGKTVREADRHARNEQIDQQDSREDDIADQQELAHVLVRATEGR